jgi:hypothetical protein
MMKSNPQRKVGEILRNAADIFDRQSELYGDNWLDFGPMMAAIFPKGLTIETADEWRRLGLLIQIANKFTRTCQTFKAGGHHDSNIDGTVYSGRSLSRARKMKKKR